MNVRIVFRLMAICIALMCSPVHAVIPAVTQYSVNNWPGSSSGPRQWYTSTGPACEAATAYLQANGNPANAPQTYTTSECTTEIYRYSWEYLIGTPSAGSGSGQSGMLVQYGVCPANSTTNGGSTCSCTAPYVENSTQTACVTPPSAWEQKCNSMAGLGSGHLEWAGTGSNACGNPGGLASNQGCLVIAGDIKVSYQTAPGVWTSGSDTGSYTGATCVPNDTAPAASKDPCVGGVSGTVNGRTRCVPLDPSTPATQTDSSTTTNPDGSTTTTTESTTCSNGKCTTTSTSTTTGGSGAGNGTSTTSTTEGIGDYCKKNPEVALCRKTNNGAGAETGEDESDGPCDDKSTIIGCMKPGAPPADQQIPKKELVYGLGGVPVSGFSAACPSPTSFVVFGRSFAISYEPLCDSAGWIKPLILLVAGLASALIVYRSLGGS